MIDVVIPTQFDEKRFWTLVHQVKSALSQGVDARVIILSSKENWDANHGKLLGMLSIHEAELVEPFLFRDGDKGDPFDTPTGYMCNPAIHAYMRQPREKLGDWQYHGGDDDCLTPWAFKYLLAASPGKGMVMGRAMTVDREYRDRHDYPMGEEIMRCHIDLSCGIIHTDSLRALQLPWLNIFTGYGDWELVARQAASFPYVLIPQVVSIKSLTL